MQLMESFMSRNRLALAFCVVAVVAYPLAAESERRFMQHEEAGLEVIMGSYECAGSVHAGYPPPALQVSAYIWGTSDIASGGYLPTSPIHNVSPDIEVAEGLCVEQAQALYSALADSCTVARIATSRSATYPNGQSTYTSFQFSCQGRRDAVVAAIGAATRALVATPRQ